jgi:hypothetical protein
MRGETRRHLHTPLSSNSFGLAVKTKAKEDFRISAMLLIFILQNCSPKNNSTITEDQLQHIT